MSASTFEGAGLASWLVKVCKEMNFRAPTEIQQKCLPPVLQGRNLVGRAKTGSGKTASFALPILQKLSVDPYGIFALVLTPTRELAFQIAEQFRAFGQPLNLKDAIVVGGLDMSAQSIALGKKPHVVIATPGRLAGLINSGGSEFSFNQLQFLVLDEADRLFEECFDKDMAVINEALPPVADRQTLLFSATITEELAVQQMQQLGIAADDFSYVETSATLESTVEELDQRYLFIPQKIKECYLAYLLRDPEVNPGAAIVFVATCRGCEVVAAFLEEMHIPCVSLNSHKNQARRMAALGKFRSGKCKILIATDVASRGLDIPEVQLVINYDLPRICVDYVHRVGRTARAGRGGMAVAMVSQYDIQVLKEIEAYVGKELDKLDCDENKALESLKVVEEAKRMAKIRLEEYDIKADENAGATALSARTKRARYQAVAASANSDSASHKGAKQSGSSKKSPSGNSNAASAASGASRPAPAAKRKAPHS